MSIIYDAFHTSVYVVCIASWVANSCGMHIDDLSKGEFLLNEAEGK